MVQNQRFMIAVKQESNAKLKSHKEVWVLEGAVAAELT